MELSTDVLEDEEPEPAALRADEAMDVPAEEDAAEAAASACRASPKVKGEDVEDAASTSNVEVAAA